MAKRIEGITIKIGADATELNKAIKTIDSELRSTQSQLRDVNRLLKLDPGNTDLIAQKQKLLGQAIEETKDKLGALKEAQEKAGEALKEGTISQQQYDALQREITETEQKLKSLEQQARESAGALEKIGSAGQKMKDAGDKMTNVGQKMMPVTLAIGALGAASVKTAADFDSAMSKVEAISGATGSDLDRLRDKAREMGEKTVFSASESAEAFQYMAMAGWKTEDMLDGIEGVMSLAAASGTDLATTSDIVTDALTAFGLSASDTTRFVDVLAAASSNSNTNVEMMGETFKYVAPVAGALGFSLEDTAEAIGLMANAGIKSSQAGTSLRTILNKLNGEFKISGKELGEVVIQTTNADGSMRDLSDILGDARQAFSQLSESEKANAAEALVGKNAMSGFLALMNAGEGDVQKLSDAINNSNGAAADMANTMNDNLAGQLKLLKSALEELAISFGEVLMPVVKKIVGWIQKLVEKFNGLSDRQKKVVAVIAAIVAAIGPVLVILGTLMGSIGNLLIFTPMLIGSLGGVGAAFGGVIAAILPILPIIAAVVAAGVLLYKNWDTIKEKALEVWEGIKGVFASLQETWNALWEGLKTVFVNFWQSLMENPVIHLFLQLITDELGIFTGTLSGIWENIRKIAGTAWELIKTVILTPIRLLIDLVTGDFEGLRKGLEQSWTRIQMLARELWGEIKDLIIGFVSDIFEGVKETFGHLIDNLADVWESIKTVASQSWQKVKETVESWANSAKDAAVNAFTNLASGISNALSGLYRIVSDAFSDAIDYIKGIVSDAGDWGYDMMVNFAEGIANGVGWVFDQVMDLVNWIEDMIGFSEPEKGPLSNFHTYGPDMMKLLAKGIRDNVGLVQDAVGDVSGILSTSVQGAGPETNNYSYGPMSINVYGAEGQDVRELARLVEDRISDNMRRTGAVFR